jgi:hypothetical protein
MLSQNVLLAQVGGMSIILEWVDLGYTKRVLEAACKLNWESLPTDRPV